MVMLSYLFIFFARVVDMALATLRILMIMRGKSIQAALVGFFESAVYILALRQVIQALDNPFRIFVYALGFAAGNYVGSIVEERMAVGYATVQVISLSCTETMVDELRKNDFGVTVIEGCGREGVHQILHVLIKRKELDRLMRLVREQDPQAFVSVMDTRKIIGGYFTRKKSK